MNKLKSYCLCIAASGKASMREPDNGEDGLYYNADDVDALIDQLQQRNAELEQSNNHSGLRASFQKACRERDELSATVERFVELRDHLPNVRKWVIEFEKLAHKTPQQNLNAVKREAIIESVGACKLKVLDGPDIYSDALIEHANNKYPSKGW